MAGNITVTVIPLAVPDGNKIFCKCGALLGEEILVGGLPFMSCGGLVLEIAGGICRTCGHPFHRSTSKQTMAEMYRHYLREVKRQ